ncbi:hypothetical protein CVT24_008883 [Panaeolus cyanescens]|uniref:Uncharacterized protein n=1 Tax=Panaeolus cyanescens TaxID=181874 RepID=A0A409VEB4_9AGAR|nr:hypothetical protein CVT24_008883 [Panaeolus cyanescens]
MSHNSTSNEPRRAGSGLADKTSSVFRLVHGAGENLRGTLLGAVDTIAKSPDGEAKNDAIATKGRAEMSRAMEVLRMPMSSRGHRTYFDSNAQTGRTAGHHAHDNQYPYTRTTETAGNYQSSAYSDPNVYPGDNTATRSTTAGATGSVGDHESTFPQHHRDDAISGLPPNQAQDLRGIVQQNQNQNQNQMPSGQHAFGGVDSYSSGGQPQYESGGTHPKSAEFQRPFR